MELLTQAVVVAEVLPKQDFRPEQGNQGKIPLLWSGSVKLRTRSYNKTFTAGLRSETSAGINPSSSGPHVGIRDAVVLLVQQRHVDPHAFRDIDCLTYRLRTRRNHCQYTCNSSSPDWGDCPHQLLPLLLREVLLCPLQPRLGRGVPDAVLLATGRHPYGRRGN